MKLELRRRHHAGEYIVGSTSGQVDLIKLQKNVGPIVGIRGLRGRKRFLRMGPGDSAQEGARAASRRRN